MGPHCRKKFGGGEPGTPDFATAAKALSFVAAAASADEIAQWVLLDARAFANRLVHRVAASKSIEVRNACTVAIAALGFVRLAEKLMDREQARGAVRVTTEGDKLVVRAPYSEDFNNACRRVPGCRWDGSRKVRVCPSTSRVFLWRAICVSFPAGTAIIGERGVTRVPS